MVRLLLAIGGLLVVCTGARYLAARSHSEINGSRAILGASDDRVTAYFMEYDFPVLNWSGGPGPEIPTVTTVASADDPNEDWSRFFLNYDFLVLDNKGDFPLLDVNLVLREWTDADYEVLTPMAGRVWERCKARADCDQRDSLRVGSPEEKAWERKRDRLERDALRAVMPIWRRLWRPLPQPGSTPKRRTIRVNAIPAKRQVAVQVATRACDKVTDEFGGPPAGGRYGYVYGYCEVVSIRFSDILGRRVEVRVPEYDGRRHYEAPDGWADDLSYRPAYVEADSGPK